MAYKFQKGTANLSGSLKLDSGYDLLGAGSNDLGTSAANFAVGYISVLSASTVVSGAFFEGSGARLTNVAATDITTTGTSTNSDFYPLFVDTAAGESGETIRVHSTVAINPSTGKVTATIFSSSLGTGSFGGGISAGNEGFTVGYTGAVTATTVAMGGALTGVTTLAASSTATIEGVVSGAAGTFDALAGTSLALQAGGITAAGAIAGATTVAMGGALTGATTISGSGALSVGAGATLAGALNMQAAGITNAGAIAGATTVDSTGLASLDGGIDVNGSNFTAATDGAVTATSLNVQTGAITNASTISGSGALSVGAGATFAGAVNLQVGGITNAGVIAGTTLLTASTGLSGTTVYANKFFGDGVGITGISSDAVDVTSSTTNQTYGVVFTQGPQTDGGLGLALNNDQFIYNPADTNGGSHLRLSGAVSSEQKSTIAFGESANRTIQALYTGGQHYLSFSNQIDGARTQISASGRNIITGGDVRLITPAGSSGVTVAGGGNLYVGSGAQISGSGQVNGLAFTGTSLDVQAGGITNAGAITGATTIAASSTATIEGVVSGAAGTFDALAGTSLALQSGGITAAGAIAGATTISGSGAVTVDSITLNGDYSISSAGAAVVASLNVSDGNITNVGDINCDSVSVDDSAVGLDIQFGGTTGLNKISLTDNLADALNITQAGNSYIKLVTTDDSEGVTFGKDVTIADGKGISAAGDMQINFKVATTGQSGLAMTDNLASAFYIHQGGSSYLKFITTNDSEAVAVNKDCQIGKANEGNDGKFLTLYGGVDFAGQKTITASVNLDEDGESGIYHGHSHYLCSGSSAITINLPSLENGYALWFKRHPSMTANVTIAPSGSTNAIDGLNDPVVLETAGAALQLVGSGSKNWYIY